MYKLELTLEEVIILKVAIKEIDKDILDLIGINLSDVDDLKKKLSEPKSIQTRERNNS
jgi:hypothetical protein